MTPAAASYAGALCGAFVLARLLTPVMLRVASRRAIVDHPRGHKLQDAPVPYLGGLAIAAAWASATVAAGVLLPAGAGRGPAVVVLIALGICLLGLVDDVRTLSPVVRLLVESLGATGVCLAGMGIDMGGGSPGAIALSVLWVVGVCNAFNLIDNMDALSAGVASVAGVFLFALAALQGRPLLAVGSLALAGATGGFLRYNRHPARIYMGDAGSLFVGFVLAVVSAALVGGPGPMPAKLAPMLVVGVALFDTALVTATRLARGQSPAEGGRDHASHRLVTLGLPVPRAVRRLHLAGAGLGLAALVLNAVSSGAGWLLLALLLALAGLAAWRLARVPVSGAGAASGRNASESR